MKKREQKVRELIAGFQVLKQHMMLRTAKTTDMPRVTPSQWGALLHIEEHGVCTVKDVAHALGISSSAATQLVDGLVESGYVMRKANAKDRRTVLLTLSSKTKTHVGKMKKRALHKFLEFFDVLDDNEFNQYLLLNKKIVTTFSK